MHFQPAHQHIFYFTFCFTLLFGTQQYQALDIAFIPVNEVQNVSTINRDSISLNFSQPRFTYRVVVNDNFHLQCTPTSDPLKYDVAKEVRTARKKDEAAKMMPFLDDGNPELAGYVHRPNFDAAFFGHQLALLQARAFWWIEAGENLTSLVAAFREKKLKDAGVLQAGMLEADGKSPLYFCRSLSNPAELGLQSLSDGLCRTVTPLLIDEGESIKDWTVQGNTLTNYQVLTNLKKNVIQSWVTLNALEVMHGGWSPPPNAVEVEIDDIKRSGSHGYHVPLYIARYKVNSSLTVVMGLYEGAQLPLQDVTSGVELLVMNEVQYRVKLRFSGFGVHPLNSLASKWDEVLDCKLDLSASKGDNEIKSEGCSCDHSLRKLVANEEDLLVDLKMSSEGSVVLGGNDSTNRKKKAAASWKIFKKSVRKTCYWGEGWGGSLYLNDPLFVAVKKDGVKVVKNSRHLPLSNRRYLCQANVEGQGFVQNHRPGFLDIISNNGTPECNLFYAGSQKDKWPVKRPYQVLYSSSPEVASRFRWTLYSPAKAEKLGALIAGYYLLPDIKFKRMFWARLVNSENSTLFGTIVAGENVFWYFTEKDNGTEEVSLKEAEKAGVQVLTLL